MPNQKSIKEFKHLTRKEKLREIIFEADTIEGRRFDVLLLWAIVFSIFVVMLSSVSAFNAKHGSLLTSLEWFFTIIFTLEYFVRIYVIEKPRKYILSGWGIIDLLSTIPTYLGLFIAGPQYLLMIRILRLLRVFRILSLKSFSKEAVSLGQSLKHSGVKITVFFSIILMIVVLMGTLMYILEGPENGFHSIPFSIYWAIVTITTVGYGDVTPSTVWGQALSSALMLIGYAVIAVPTGIISVDMAKQSSGKTVCNRCGNKNNDGDARYCKICAEPLSHKIDT